MVPLVTVVTRDDDDEALCAVPPQAVRLKNTEILSNLSKYFFHLSAGNGEDIQMLLSAFPELFGDIPS